MSLDTHGGVEPASPIHGQESVPVDPLDANDPLRDGEKLQDTWGQADVVDGRYREFITAASTSVRERMLMSNFGYFDSQKNVWWTDEQRYKHILVSWQFIYFPHQYFQTTVKNKVIIRELFFVTRFK